mgnify:CR=1 FL=1
MDHDTLVYLGGAVKALGDGRVGGHLVLFSTAADPDLTGDYFTPATNLRIKAGASPILLYEHGMDPKVGDREIGEAKASVDELGVWVEAQLAMRDAYEEAIYKLAESGKLGWSSGTAGHLVRRKKVGKSFELTSWPIVEASLTTHPAEPRTSAVPLKSLYPGSAPDSFPEWSSELAAGFERYRTVVATHAANRVKAGRVLSAANRGRIASVVAQVKPMLADLESLLAETDPTPPQTPSDATNPEPEAGTDTLARWKALRLKALGLQHRDLILTGNH